MSEARRIRKRANYAVKSVRVGKVSFFIGRRRLPNVHPGSTCRARSRTQPSGEITRFSVYSNKRARVDSEIFRCFSHIHDPHFRLATRVIRQRHRRSRGVDRDIRRRGERGEKEKSPTLFDLRKLGHRRQTRSEKLPLLSMYRGASAKLISIRYGLIRFQPAAVNCVRNCARGHEEKISRCLLTPGNQPPDVVLSILELSKHPGGKQPLVAPSPSTVCTLVAI